jgi:hypothetical protein
MLILGPPLVFGLLVPFELELKQNHHRQSLIEIAAQPAVVVQLHEFLFNH